MLLLLQTRLEQIRHSASRPEALCRKKRLHTFRVALKHWRAHLRLLRAVDPTFPYPEVYAPFKSLFTQAGKARLWQLQAAVVKKMPGVPDSFAQFYQKHIRDKHRNACKRLRKSSKKSDLPTWDDLQNELHYSVQACTPEALLAYFHTLREDIHTALRARRLLPPDVLHEVRKSVKEYEINRLAVEQQWGMAIPAALDVGLSHGEFDDLLGQWHDLEAACARLVEDLERYYWPPEIAAMGNQVLQSWQARERRARQEVLAQIHLARPA